MTPMLRCGCCPTGGAAASTSDRITGHATPVLANLDIWKPHAGLKPRPLDQAVSSITEFDNWCGKLTSGLRAPMCNVGSKA